MADYYAGHCRILEGTVLPKNSVKAMITTGLWTYFGLVGNTEKKLWANYEQLLMVFFYVFWKFFINDFFFNSSVRTKKLQNMSCIKEMILNH